MTPRLSRALAPLVALALVVAASLVAATTPTQDALEEPFATRGEPGERLTGRTLEATLLDARLADEVRGPDWRGTTDGVWLVVELEVAAVLEQSSVEVDLLVGDRRYASSSRPSSDALDQRVVEPRLLQRGVALIELPASLVDDPHAASAVLRLSPRLDARLDSVLEVPLDLAALPHDDVVEFDPPRPVAR